MEGNSWKILIYEGEILASHHAAPQPAPAAGNLPPAEPPGRGWTSPRSGLGDAARGRGLAGTAAPMPPAPAHPTAPTTLLGVGVPASPPLLPAGGSMT